MKIKLVQRGDIIYVIVNKRSKNVIGVFGNEGEAKNHIKDLGEDEYQIHKRLFGYTVFQ